MRNVYRAFCVTFATIFISRCIDARHVFEGIPTHIMGTWHRTPRPGDSSSLVDRSAPKNISHVCCKTSEYKCCVFVPETDSDDDILRMRARRATFAKWIETLPTRLIVFVLGVVFIVHCGLFVCSNTEPGNYFVSVRVAGGQGLASVLAVFELVGTLLLGRDNEDDWEDVTDESCDMDASMATFIVRLQKLRKRNSALAAREQRQRSIIHKTALTLVNKKSKYQSLQKCLKFEYIQLQIFENILMEELIQVDPEQVRQFKKRQAAACDGD